MALYVGRVAPEKNIELAITAFRAIQRRNAATKLVIVGDGPLRTRLQQKYPDLNFEGLRRDEQLAACYASADVFLFPSETETFGNVVLEAMASGLAVVAYDYAAARMHVTSGETGMRVPYADAGAFVAAAVRLARFNTRRKLIVAFSGAHHGWWDGVQPGLGSARAISDCLTLKDMHPASLDVIRKRSKEIAGVLINPVQSFHPNAPPPSDAVLLTSTVRQTQDLTSDYTRWLRQLREVCRECNVPLIFDEVYSGFRLAPGGAHRPGGAAVVRAHGAGGRVARRVPDVEAQHVAGDDLVHQAGHRSLHRHRGLLAPLHQR